MSTNQLSEMRQLFSGRTCAARPEAQSAQRYLSRRASAAAKRKSPTPLIASALFGVVTLSLVAGCGGSSGASGNRHFFTSGSRDADQRADQRMAKSEQLAGQGDRDKPNYSPDQTTLYQRLGGDAGIKKIVDDFLTRAMDDPRVNWNRVGVNTGSFFVHHKYKPTESTVVIRQHMTEFLALATGGPSNYHGKQIQDAHAGMKITNAEFDACIGDLKATLDKFQIVNRDQKELLSIVESTRTQIVEKR